MGRVYVPLKFNPRDRWTVTTERIGEDRNPIIIIDDVLANADEVRECGLRCPDYLPGSVDRYYPGFLGACSTPELKELVTWVAQYLWTDVYALPSLPFVDFDLCRTDDVSLFALFAPDPDTEYFHVHVDTHAWLASLIYLTDMPDTGTAFWRDRTTGLQSFLAGDIMQIQKLELFGVKIVDKLRDAFALTNVMSIRDVQSRLVATRSMKPPYPAEDTKEWELLKLVPMKYNRAVFYPTWQFHSIAVPSYRVPTKPADARLTLNTMIEYPMLMAPPLPVVDLDFDVE